MFVVRPSPARSARKRSRGSARGNGRLRLLRLCSVAFGAVATGTLACGGDPGGPLADSACVVRLAPNPPPLLRVGGTILLELEVTEGCDARSGLEATWSSSRPGVATVEAGEVSGRAPGTTSIAADAGGGAAELTVTVAAESGDGSFTIEGLGLVEDARTTDLWVHGDVALTGTGLQGACGGTGEPCTGKPIRVWDLSDPVRPRILTTVPTEAHHVNDVKFGADGRFAVASGEGGAPGVFLVDMTDPAAPTLVTRFGEGLETGVHNVWVERVGGVDYVFVAANGTGATGGLHVLDVSDLASPRRVAHWFDEAGEDGSFVHDVLVRDGLAFVSHWDGGLVILDVGHGIRGGSPEGPVEVSRIATKGGQTHNAWYWADRRLVFVGEEDRVGPGEPPGAVGRVHVVDVSDLAAPVEVASFGVSGDSPHNFWLDEDRAVLFAAWYSRGIRALDVSGTLEGRLEDQGRELGSVVPTGPRGPATMWAPQLHGGLIYAADQNNGLWVLAFQAP